MTETVRVRRVSSTSIGITLPKRILKALKLKAGDHVQLTTKLAIGGPCLVMFKEKEPK
jgi:antitoxin component of MazEF toxin-antitoxin module